jgi:hypothetical protein
MVWARAIIVILAAYASAADLTPSDIRGLFMVMTSTFLHGSLAVAIQLNIDVVASMSSCATMFRTCSLSLILGIIVVVILTGNRRQAQT